MILYVGRLRTPDHPAKVLISIWMSTLGPRWLIKPANGNISMQPDGMSLYLKYLPIFTLFPWAGLSINPKSLQILTFSTAS
jgi:hypothetical protein